MPRKVIGAFCFFKDDMYLVINCSYCPIYIYIYIAYYMHMYALVQ